jgi:tRNA-2-methylthio-N6-dimethylallyladenosine synthase
VQEITLLGQNVNSYGRDLYGEPRFAELLRAVGTSGVPRVRFATSHPKDLSDATIAAMAETPAVMPALHLPAQSGSSRILKLMNRTYNREQYLELAAKVKAAVPGIALSTDLIVGFPGETEEDFLQTLSLVKEVGYSQTFTFIYSKRAGTPAAEMPDDTPREVTQERFDRLVEVVQECAHEANQQELGQVVPVLFEGTSKRDDAMLAGRSPRNQTVHAPLPAGADPAAFAGTIRNVRVDEAKTWYLKGTLLD